MYVPSTTPVVRGDEAECKQKVGSLSNAPATDINVSVFDRAIEINLKGTMLCVRAVSKAMSTQDSLTHEGRHGLRSLRRGSIVNLGSISSLAAGAGMMAYTASKHAVIGITKTAGILMEH